MFCYIGRAVKFSILELKDPSMIKRHEMLLSITHSMVVKFLDEFYRTLFIECFATGNLTPQVSIEIPYYCCKYSNQNHNSLHAIFSFALKYINYRVPTFCQCREYPGWVVNFREGFSVMKRVWNRQ